MGDGKDFRTCMQQSLSLPTGYYFCISAASHNPAGKMKQVVMVPCNAYLLELDDHDLISFETWQLNLPAKTQVCEGRCRFQSFLTYYH